MLTRLGCDAWQERCMDWVLIIIAVFVAIVLALSLLTQLSYIWLNICCGHTDGGGLNVDIVQHSHVPNYKQVTNVLELPFRDRQFAHALCSHTIEHVDDPEAFDAELRRVSENVTYAVPPLWDIGAALNVFEHRWIFLTFRTKHENKLPPYVKLPFARTVQKLLGQTIAA